MKHTIKMLLIPENVYYSLINNVDSGNNDLTQMAFNKRKQKQQLQLFKDPVSVDSTDVPRVKIREILNNKQMNPDARLLQYTQQYNLYRKLLKDKKEHPISVKMENLADALQHANLIKPPQTPSTTTADPITTPFNTPTALHPLNNTPATSISKDFITPVKTATSKILLTSPSRAKSTLLDYVASNHASLNIADNTKAGAYVDYLIDPSSFARAPNGYSNFLKAAKLDPYITKTIRQMEELKLESKQQRKLHKNIQGKGSKRQKTTIIKSQTLKQQQRFKPQLWF